MSAPKPEVSRIVSVAEALQAPVEKVIEADPGVSDLTVRAPTLEEAFLGLTGEKEVAA